MLDADNLNWSNLFHHCDAPYEEKHNSDRYEH